MTNDLKILLPVGSASALDTYDHDGTTDIETPALPLGVASLDAYCI